MMAKYDALNPPALKRLLAGGTILTPFSNEILAAAYKESEALYHDFAAKDPAFKKIYDHWYKFRADQAQWFSIAEGRFDSFMAATQRSAQRAAGAKK
jgi:TRAP-type mannitol/chloroaromatic compound transport system substrate-binding protein